MTVRWGLLRRYENRLDGYREHIMFENCLPLLFLTRDAARKYASENYYYYKCPDLRREPHGWKMPIPVRVKIERAGNA